MTKLLLDQGLAPGVARILRMESWDVWHVSELGMAQADDTQILERARNEHRVCVTLDHDFHMHLAVAEEGSPSVVLLRVQHLRQRVRRI